MAEQSIEVDPAVLADQGEHDYESLGYDTSTASLSSSINEYIFENGRRYHAYFGVDKNPLPTNEKEQDRLDLHHEIMLQLLDGKLHLAPIRDLHNILDVGTGTGIWSIDMADKYPNAQVVGTDISPIQPSWVPPNCKFEVDDAEQDWTFADNSFEFVHARNLAQSISDWPKFMKNVYRCTKPGGYAELAELGIHVYSDDSTLTEENAFKKVITVLNDAYVKMGRPQATGDQMKQHLQNAGFVDVKVTAVKQPYGPWPKNERMKRIGAMVMLMCETGLEAYSIAPLTRVLGMKPDEAQSLCRGGLNAIKNKNNHMYNFFFVAYGRKPE